MTVAEESVENRESTGTTDVHVSVSPEIATAEHAPIGYVGRSWYSLLDNENTRGSRASWKVLDFFS